MLKISGGALRGRLLHSPKGSQTRPTSAQARAAIFNMMGQQCDGWRVLDLFAGSGALGIEAVSRGATEAVFVESHRLAIQALKQNITDLGIASLTKVFPLACQAALDRLQGSFDLIMADPPYDLMIEGCSAAEWIAERVDAHGLLSESGWCIVEARHAPKELRLKHLDLLDVRRYGDTCVWILRPRKTSAEDVPLSIE
jgi:16S rRNA (guanine966-N2)-methyltransferase